MNEIDILRRQLSGYEHLLEVSRELSGTLNLDRVLDLALVKAEEICHAEASSLWELDSEQEELFFRVVRGRAAGQIRDLRVPLGEGIVGHAALTGEAEIINDVAADPRWRGDPAGFVTRAMLVAPLRTQGRVVGVIQLLNPAGESVFREHDLQQMRLFAGFLAQAIENARLYASRRRQFLETVTALAEATERRDPYTGGHTQRTVAYSLLLGTELGLANGELEDLWLAAALHDIGKIATPDAVLRKPAPLDTLEQEIMRQHTAAGAEILNAIGSLRGILPAIRGHHERFDGCGYPDGLSGDQLPLLVRILAVADTFDAMTTDRPYRRALQPHAAAREIAVGVGSQFCPRVVAAFKALFDRGGWDLDAGHAIAERLIDSYDGRGVRD